MTKVERLLTLMSALLAAPRALTAEELRERVPAYPASRESFKRAFERDKEDLRDLGVPLLVEWVPGTDPPIQGYRVHRRDLELRDPGLTPAELEALNLAAAVVGTGGDLGRRGLLKLGAGGGSGRDDGSPTESLPADPDLVAAFAGVAERRRLRFSYRGTDRTVDPYRLEFLRGRWYLNGFDHGRREDRWYRMSRIDGGVATDGGPNAFVRPVEAVPGLQLDPWALGAGVDADPVEARVWFDPAIASAVRAELRTAEVERDDAEGLVVRITVSNPEGFRSWLASFLDRAEILGPPDLRRSVVAWLEEVAGGR